MRKLMYVVNGQEITSYEKARKLQPKGKLTTVFKEIVEHVKPSPETLAKRNAYFAKLGASH